MTKAVFFLLWCLVFIVPWEGIFVIEELTTGARLLGAAVFAAAVVAVVASASMRRLHVAFIPLAAFVLWNWLSLAWTITPEQSLGRCVTFSLLFAFVWLIWEFAPSPKAQRLLMWAFILGNGLVLAATYMQFFLGDLATGGRYTAAETNPNAAAIDAVFAICFLLYGMNTLSRGLRIASCGYILAAGLAALLTGSRAGLGALAICILLNLAGFRRIGWGQAFAILVCLFCGWLLAPQAAVELFTSRLGETERARGLGIRQEAWIGGLRTWETNPLLGVGAGSYRVASERGGGPSLVAHNTLINVLVEDGLVGFGIFLFICVMLLRLVWRMPPRERGFWIALLGAYGEYCFFASQEYQKATWLVLALILVQSEAFRRPQVPSSPAARQGRMTAAGTAPLGKRDAG